MCNWIEEHKKKFKEKRFQNEFKFFPKEKTYYCTVIAFYICFALPNNLKSIPWFVVAILFTFMSNFKNSHEVIEENLNRYLSEDYEFNLKILKRYIVKRDENLIVAFLNFIGFIILALYP